jgi:integrase
MGSVRKSPRNAGRWEARYRDSAGRQRTQTLDSRASAKAWLSTTEADMQRGGWIDPRLTATKLEVIAVRWLDANPGKRAGSIARDRSILTNHILPALGHRAVGAVTQSDVQRLVNDWAARCSPSTVLRHYACMRGLFSYAASCDLITRSPCRTVRLPEARPREAQILDTGQLERLADAMGPYGAMLYLAALGLRWGEIAGLRVGDVDFLRGTVTVVKQRTRGEKGRMIEQDPKTRAGRRSLSIPDWVTAMLSEHLVKGGLTGRDISALVFVSPGHEPLHYSNWRRRVWLPACAAAGLYQLTFHDLKHTAATVLVEEGVDVKTAQVRLGHASPLTTLGIYAQVTERADRMAADRVGDRLRPRSDGSTIGRHQSTSRPQDA